MKSSIEHVTLTWNTTLLQKGDWLDLEILDKTAWSASLERNGIKNSKFKFKNSNFEVGKSTGIQTTESVITSLLMKSTCLIDSLGLCKVCGKAR
jgi:hypothetical protein